MKWGGQMTRLQIDLSADDARILIPLLQGQRDMLATLLRGDERQARTNTEWYLHSLRQANTVERLRQGLVAALRAEACEGCGVGWPLIDGTHVDPLGRPGRNLVCTAPSDFCALGPRSQNRTR